MKRGFNILNGITMKKIYIMMMLVLTGMMAQAQVSVWDGSKKMWTKGSGTENDPYLIESAENLAFLSYMVNMGYDTYGLNFKLTTDIDLNGSEDQQWIPIGQAAEGAYYEDGCERQELPTYIGGYVSFKGHFDGDDHRISNIYFSKDYVTSDGQIRACGTAGLFGVLEGAGEIPTVVENVFVTNGYVRGANSGGIVGIAVGNNSGMLISRCFNGAEIEGSYAGGIVGGRNDQMKVSIHNCNNFGNVKGSSSAGGIAGSSATEVIECYNNGNVTGDYFGGGIVGGSLSGNSIISNCYNTGNISITGNSIPASFPGNPVGGIVGMIWTGSHTISNCYNVGMVACENNEPGGVVGAFGNSGIVENAYYLVNCGGEGEGIAKTAEDMRDPSFVDILNNGTNVWCADTLNHNDGYPILGANNLAVDEFVVDALVVYPNPNHGQFTVEGTGVLTVFNVLGQAVLTREIHEKTVLELSKGLYFIRLKNGNIVSTQKVVINE